MSPSHIVLVLIKYLIENGGKFLLANLHCKCIYIIFRKRISSMFNK